MTPSRSELAPEWSSLGVIPMVARCPPAPGLLKLQEGNSAGWLRFPQHTQSLLKLLCSTSEFPELEKVAKEQPPKGASAISASYFVTYTTNGNFFFTQ